MEDEDAALAAGALLRAQEDPQAGVELDGDSLSDNLVEIEHDGQLYKIPSALKGAFLMNADYTRKTQELAEHRRALDEDRATLAHNAEAAHTALQDQAKLQILDHQLEMFAGADWQTILSEDPQRAQTLWAQGQQIKAVRDQFAQSLAHHEQTSRLAAERELADQMAKAGEVLSREVEGWSPEVANKLVEYASAFGVTLDELREVADPRLWKILHRAYAGEQVQQQQQAAKNAAQAQAVRPAVQVTGGAIGAGSVRDDLATGEWMKRRNEQMLKAR